MPRNQQEHRFRRCRGSLLTLACTAVVCGCGPRATHFDIVDHRTEGGTTRYFEDFDECYYSVHPAGRFDFVARRIGAGERDPAERITQIVHLRGIWHAVPGRTFAEDTMINATVSYMIVSGPGGASFEGGGFVSFRENRKRTIATGKLELAKLAPMRRLGAGRQIFQLAEIKGEFKATRDRRQVMRILTEMRRLFGPMPRYEPRPTGGDIL